MDEVIVFHPLSREDYAKIAALTLEEYVTALKEKAITFAYDEKATAFIAEKTYNGKSGARDIRNFIRREVEDPLAEMLVERGEDAVGGVQVTTAEDGQSLLLLTI